MQSRSNHRNYSGRLTAFILGVLFCTLPLLFSSPTQAQTVIQDGDTYTIHGTYPPGFQITTNDKTARVSTTVPDTTKPSTPILIAPTDGAILTDSTPTFVWTESTDNVGVIKYNLYLDGEIYTPDIPTNSTTDSAYALVFNSSTGEFSLTHIGSIADGNHTWKVTAQDAAGNTATSTTWSFLIDTQSPTFVISAIGSQTTSISAQDVSTVPSTPIELSENEPLISGTGEANSSVILTLRKLDTGELLETIPFTIGSDGTWELQLGALERDIVYNLTFQITDQAGLISIIENVPLVVKGFVIEIPIPGGLVPIEGPIEIPIPVIPAEVATRTIHVTELAITEFSNTIFASSSSQSSKRILSPLWYTHLLVLVVLLFLPTLKFFLLAVPFGRNYSLNIGASIWRAIFGFPIKNRESLIINDDDQATFPFVTVRLIPVNHDDETRVFLSDQYGYLPTMPLIDGLYLLRATIDEHPASFSKKQPTHLVWEDWYQGQSINLKTEHPMKPLVLPITNDEVKKVRGMIKRWLLRRPIDSFGTLLFATLIIIVTPTIGNFISIIAYGGIWMIQSWNSRKTNCRITTATTSKVLVPKVVVRLESEEELRTSMLYQTNKAAEALIQIKTGSYRCVAAHYSYRQKTLNLIEIKGDEETSSVVILTPTLA